MATADYNGVQKAAILLITLGPERSADIFKHLKEEEIEELTLEIANTRSVSPQVKEDIYITRRVEEALPSVQLYRKGNEMILESNGESKLLYRWKLEKGKTS